MQLFIFIGVDFKNMPPCRDVLLNKMKRTNYLAEIIKHSTENIIKTPKEGWIMNENNEMEIEYFACSPYPEDIANIMIADDTDEEDSNIHVSSSDDDESYSDDFEDGEWD